MKRGILFVLLTFFGLGLAAFPLQAAEPAAGREEAARNEKDSQDDMDWGDDEDWGDDDDDWGGDEWDEEGDGQGARSIRQVLDQLPFELKGFMDARAGVFTQKNRHIRRDASLGELRLQLEAAKQFGRHISLNYKGDSRYDAVDDDTAWETREANVALTLPDPLENLDIKMGRQILTWGTGDLLFINDLFPKDWNAFFLGRDTEYLKSPSDAGKVSAFWSAVNLDLVYVPRFNPDVYIDGRRVSYWNNVGGTLAGQDNPMHDVQRDDWFKEHEVHARLYRTFGSYEAAAYGYWGYWKSPGGMDLARGEAIFPRLHVYGASLRGPVLSGIATLEAGYYDSRQDAGGRARWVNNSECRFLAGYEREVGEKFTAGLQYYLECMMDYGDYRRSGPAGVERRDENRHVLTLRLTKLLMQEDLKLSMFAYYSPSDHDAYLRPHVRYKFSDNVRGEAGANVFTGRDRHTFFGQFGQNTNLYLGLRYHF